MIKNKKGLLSLVTRLELTNLNLSSNTVRKAQYSTPTRSMPNRLLLLTLVCGIGGLTGCSDRVMLAEDKMSDIRASTAQQVKPPPEPQLVEDYTYDSTDIRSPFVPPSLVNKEQVKSNFEGIAPDITRKKQPLESFELTELSYRGLVVSPEGQQYGLIQRPDGVVDSVKVGDYMGTSDGRIVEITPTQINLIEIVPDNRAGFIEKPASVVSPI